MRQPIRYTGVAVGSTTSNTFGPMEAGSLKGCWVRNFPASQSDNVQTRVPTKVIPIATQSQGTVLCGVNLSRSGWQRIVTNQLQDQFGQAYAHAGINMADMLSFGSTNQLGLSPVTGSSLTSSNGTWSDLYSDCTTACPSSGESDALQSWTYNSIPLPHVDSVIYKCTSVTIDGF